MKKLTRADVLRKCIIVFDAIRRHSSKGNAGLEAAKGAEESFAVDTEICDELRQMLRELEAGEQQGTPAKVTEIRDWQEEIMANGAPERLTL